MVNDANGNFRTHRVSNLLIQSQAPKDLNHIHNLSDELLVEILCRLPCSKCATQCKCVCKHWTSLISHPYFITRFITCKVGGCSPCIDDGAFSSKRILMNPEEKYTSIKADSDYGNCTSRFERINIEMFKEQQAFATIVRTSCPYNFLKGIMMCLDDPIFNPKSLSFSSLPSFEDRNSTHVTVVGACNDLFLYCKRDDSKYYYYICNVQTKKWLVLPPQVFFHSIYFLIGFICDPYYYYDNERGDHMSDVTLNAAYRYTTVVVPYEKGSATTFSAHVLSSKTSSQWRERVMSLPRSCQLYREEPGFGFRGMLHFLCVEGIIGFDPYDDENTIDGVIQCHFIGWPLGFLFKMVRVGVCQGWLHISNYLDDRRLAIWVLKDYERGEWCLRHSIELQEWITSDPRIAAHLNQSSFPGYVIGFHHTNSDVIYLRLVSGEIVFCNLSRRTLEIVSQDPGIALYRYIIVVQIKLPVWPTPLPTVV